MFLVSEFWREIRIRPCSKLWYILVLKPLKWMDIILLIQLC